MSIYGELAFVTIYGFMCIGLGAVVGVFWERHIREKPVAEEPEDDPRDRMRR